MRPRWHFVLSFTKHSVQQNPSPLDPQSNLMVLVQWHQKASPSGSLQTAFSVVPLSTRGPRFFFSISDSNALLKHTPYMSLWSWEAYAVYMQSLSGGKKKKKRTFLKMSWRSSGTSKSLKTSQRVLHVKRRSISPRRSHTPYADFLPSTARIKVAFVSQQWRGHVYMSLLLHGGVQKHVNIKRG